MTSAKVKICGLYREEDIHMINDFCPDYVGFVIHVPKSHRNVTVEQVLQWKKILAPSIQTVGVFVDENPDLICQVASVLDVIQLHGSEGEGALEGLRKRLPDKEFWKAFAVKTTEDVAAALSFPADKILLDYGKGEGKSFDWHILKKILAPYILAGGITPENVKEAISLANPEIIDLSSGVETNKVKDPEKIKQLLKEMKR
ncbi:MAG: phosphoribosylanthranilate isomerase [Eubacteriales bacterium]